MESTGKKTLSRNRFIMLQEIERQNIDWIKKRLNPQVIKRSVNSLLPHHRVKTYQKTKDSTIIDEPNSRINEKMGNYNINPTYLFSPLILEKILKLKEIFLEFDEDGSRKLEIDEIVEMFNRNDIIVNKDEMTKLFFNGRSIKKGDKPFLNFFQFLEFALSNHSDQLFRNFMRKVKIEFIKSKGNENENKIFFPMNFNLVLDYFNNKGKDRKFLEKIEETLKNMEDYIKNDVKENNNPQINKQIENKDLKITDASEIITMFEKLFLPKNLVSKMKKEIDYNNGVKSESSSFLLNKNHVHDRIEYMSRNKSNTLISEKNSKSFTNYYKNVKYQGNKKLDGTHLPNYINDFTGINNIKNGIGKSILDKRYNSKDLEKINNFSVIKFASSINPIHTKFKHVPNLKFKI